MPFKKKELQHFKDLLMKKRQELLDTINARKQLSFKNQEIVVEEIEQASQASEQALHMRLLDKDLKLLREIDLALARFEEGTYGLCEGTGEEIDRKRLELRPWTRYSLDYKEELEQKKKREKLMR
ncbi:MAG: TraR/DksA family transcriptional regulator [Myxococcales bacterium]|nr:MAG: TraR/DksA family transcriptional regulator [Myxococcales bacterium]